jgi:hypothetical protein
MPSTAKGQIYDCPKCGALVFDAAAPCLLCGAPPLAPVASGKLKKAVWLLAYAAGSFVVGSWLSSLRERTPEIPAYAAPPGVVVQQSADSTIEAVRNGTIEGHQGATVGMAFEGAFQNIKWSSHQTAAGQTVVQFEGTANPEALAASGFLPAAVDGLDNSNTQGIPVRFQFTLSTDKRTVYLEHADEMPFEYVDGNGLGVFSAERTLDYVYKVH